MGAELAKKVNNRHAVIQAELLTAMHVPRFLGLQLRRNLQAWYNKGELIQTLQAAKYVLELAHSTPQLGKLVSLLFTVEDVDKSFHDKQYSADDPNVDAVLQQKVIARLMRVLCLMICAGMPRVSTQKFIVETRSS